MQTEVHRINVIFKWALITAGIVFIAAGVITFWLPIPIGIPLLLLGLPLVLKNSPHGRRWLIYAGRHGFPKLYHSLHQRIRTKKYTDKRQINE